MTIPTSLNVTRPQAEGYDARLIYGNEDGEDIYVQLAPSGNTPVLRSTAEPSNQSPQLASNPEDFRPESGRIFSRSLFSGGEGLDKAHRARGGSDDPLRYWASEDIWINVAEPGVPEEIKLAWANEAITGTGTPATPFMVKVADGTRVFWANGSDVKWSDNILAGTPSIISEDPEAGGTPTTIDGLALLGKQLYAAIGAEGIHRRTWAGAWSHWSNLDADKIWGVKGRIFASVTNTLYEAASGAGSVILKALDTADDSWTDIIDGGHLVLAAATDGKVYAFSDESGQVVLRSETEMRPGEVPVALGYADGIVFIGTADKNVAGGKIGRLYIAQYSGVKLVGSRLVREWGDETSVKDHSPAAITATRDQVLFALLDDDGEMCVWSYLLATVGTWKRLNTSGVTRPQDIVVVDGQIVVSVPGAALVREHGTYYAASGWIIFPYADWYSAADKAIIGLRINSKDIAAAGMKIEFYYATDPDALLDENSALWTLAKTLNTSGVSESQEIPLLNVTGRGVALMVKMTRSTSNVLSPVVRSISARAFENLEDVLVRLPVNISDQLERPGRTPLRVRGRGTKLYAALREREGLPVEVHILRTGEKVKGRVESVELMQPAITPRGSSLLSANVVVRGVEVNE